MASSLAYIPRAETQEPLAPKKRTDTQDHVARNRIAWNRIAREYVEPARRAWKQTEPAWGIWGIPESEARILPESVKGLDVIELGCGAAYVSAWLARRGARVTGIDNSEEQLKTARAMQKEHGLAFPLIRGNAEQVPLPGASFDLAISEYGASIWCDPYRWIPEASRLLRPGGRLVFLVHGTILMLCSNDDENIPASPALVRDYFGMHRFEFPDGDGAVEFHLGYGDWIRLFKANSFEIDNLIELRPKEGAETRYTYVRSDWARRWPSEEVWVARKDSSGARRAETT
jgi:SAM-dependent methyltransferase